MRFSYNAVDKANLEINGTIEATSLTEALHKLGKMGLFPLDVSPEQSTTVKKRQSIISRLRSVSLFAPVKKKLVAQDLVIFTRQLSVLIDAGLPLVRALDTLQRQARFVNFRSMISELVEIIQAGGSLSDAMGHYPESFSNVYINIVRAGETGGAMDLVLRQLADYQEKNLKLKHRIHAALIYPALVLLVSIGILTFMIAVVIPKFAELFSGTGVKLPALTAFMMSLSGIVRHYWFIVLIGIALITVVFKFAIKHYVIRYFRDKLILRIPVFGEFNRKIIASRFTRTLSTLLGGGVPILRSLELAKDVNENEVVAQIVNSVYENVREGGFIANVLEQSDVFPQLMTDMIAVGEESGSLEKMLGKVAQTFEDEVELTAGTMAALLEPILVIGMGLITGLIVLSLFLPMISLIEALSV